MKKTVAVGLSGGVDSAVAALLLKQQDFDVTGVFLYCFDQAGIPCTADEDRKMAVRIADFLHIPIKIIDLRREYTRSVIDYFFSEYRVGRTPNPDVMCNKEIKFGLFYKKAILDWGMNYVATGHYARITASSFWGGAKRRLQNRPVRRSPAEPGEVGFWTHSTSSGQASQNDGKEKFSSLSLTMGRDKSKDQSYFLYPLKANQLEHILFPIGDYKKDQVRKIARENKLPNWDRPDSQGICFIGEINIKKFLSTKFKVQKGLVISRNGEIIGEHDGVWFYTIGQRHGFKIGQMSPHPNPLLTGEGMGEVELRDRKPLYILSKNSKRNELIVGEIYECFSNEFNVENFHWLDEALSLRSLSDLGNLGDLSSLTVRIRHLGQLHKCRIIPNKFYKRYNSYKIILRKPAFAVASGQSAVVYSGDILLGGGVIK